MTIKTTLLRLVGLMLCATVFAGTASAGNSGAPGNSANAPGQEKKAEQPAPTEASPGNSAQAPGQETKAEAQAGAKAEPAPPAQVAHGQERKAERQAAKVAKTQPKSAVAVKAKAKASAKQAEQKPATEITPAAKPETERGSSALAHHHVIICHRTGSDSNPYVVINIPLTAWQHAHAPGGHPTLNGRDDILLKDPASRPGSKDGFSKSACGASVAAVAGTATTTTATTTTGTTLTATASVAGSVTTPVLQPAATVTTAGPAVAATGSRPEASGVLGAVSPAKAAPAKQPAGGVLGATARAGKQLGQTAATGSLPFTGIPLWIAALIGGALLAVGLTLRRSA